MPSESIERKLVLPPASASALLKQLRGDTPGGADLSAREILEFWEQYGAKLLPFITGLSGVEEMEFSTGPSAKAEKLAAGRAGNIFVQHGITLASGGTEEQLKIALSHRSLDNHKVTTGGSIMTSGDIRKPVHLALKKVRIEPELQPSAFERLGLGLSDLQQTGGIPYLFLVTRGHLEQTMSVTSQGDDRVTMVSAAEAEQVIQGKRLELAVLQRMCMGS